MITNDGEEFDMANDSIKFDKSKYLIDTWLEKNLGNVNSRYLALCQNKSKEQD